MPRAQCLRHGAALRKPSQISRASSLQKRYESTKPTPQTKPSLNVRSLLHERTWSVRSLRSPTSSTSSPSNPADQDSTSSAPETETITPQQLHRLLRLSALPSPAPDSPLEKSMLDTLHQQLHFVRAVQAVDTTGVEPLVAVREETFEAVQERTIGLQDPEIQRRLREERIVGRRRRPRWVRGDTSGGAVQLKLGGGKEKEGKVNPEPEIWDPLSTASRKVGRYFVVDSSVPPPDTPSTGEASEKTPEPWRIKIRRVVTRRVKS